MSYLFDTEALMAMFDNEAGAERISGLIREVENGAALGYVSVVTLSEIYYLYARRRGPMIARERVGQVMASSLRILPINESIASKAGAYKLKRIPLADALIAACAHSVGARVVTDDEHFDGLGVETMGFSGKA